MKKIILSTILITTAIALTACNSNTTSKIEATLEQPMSTTSGQILGSDIVSALPSNAAVPVYSNMAYYLSAKLEEYKAYSLVHPDYTLENIVTYVNIGLDNAFYTNTKVIQKPEDILVLCNKYNSLPDNYVPSDLVEVTTANSAASGLKLRKEAAQAFDKLCDGAKQAGYTIFGASGYRSYSTQKSLYNNYAASDGVTNADTYSARPGFSEHQTGLAIDVKNATVVYDSFGTTPEYQWAKDNVQKYGFIIRYLPSTIGITGYKSEEWHFRYVGVDTATAVYALGITYDEYCARYLMK
ncbi:M15 family metallopeptidase [[Clostridium] fimetarium]|uniref:LD-carboxypeptidase LdcB, LAS superfamily n=1 Tax=[Clostridium] fimetarium TaxID=99656 RepID=A0A1I0QSS3_9FIRM|nr:M15 family metallopeptidase [[Clostridium] fimetarium]SEW30470.1 LD-carboxypeptidase LdcB, LAS superfamily [[Clostridium] fimetarium]